MSEPGPQRIIAVIPARDEAATIVEVVEETCRHCSTVVVVDDASTDDTAARLEGLPVTVLRNSTQQGKGACLRRGANHALAEGADVVITLDGDGQHDPGEIPRLVSMARHRPHGIIIGARLRQPGQAPRLRRFANRFADFWIAWAAGCPIRDTQSGFRLYPAQLLSRIQVPHHRTRSFVFESEILIEAVRSGWLCAWIEVATIYRPGARPSHYRPWLDTLRIVHMVAGKLIRKWLHPLGLLRSLGWRQDTMVMGHKAPERM